MRTAGSRLLPAEHKLRPNEWLQFLGAGAFGAGAGALGAAGAAAFGAGSAFAAGLAFGFGAVRQ